MLRQMKWVSTKLTYYKERSFTSKYLIFMIIASVYKPLIKSLFDVPTIQMSIFVLFVSARDLFGSAYSFPVSIFK